MRAFIALEFSDEAKDYLYEYLKLVRTACKCGNFSTKENFHITLKFLGEIDRSDLPTIITAMAQTASRNKAFQLSFSEFGFFPRGEKNVMFVGTKESPALKRIFAGLEKNMMREGFAPEKKGLTPHVTLGREVEMFMDKGTVKNRFPLSDIKIDINSISLMESVRVGSRLVYKELYKGNLV